MAIESMTGFARAAGTAGIHGWAWEIRSVNGRGLDLRLRLPPGFDAVEVAVRRTASAALGRPAPRDSRQLLIELTRKEWISSRPRLDTRKFATALPTSLLPAPAQGCMAPPMQDVSYRPPSLRKHKPAHKISVKKSRTTASRSNKPVPGVSASPNTPPPVDINPLILDQHGSEGGGGGGGGNR